ncbi:ead/Ea22-like family protein [Klebsiella pneumoniae]
MTDITELAQSLKNAASKALIEEGLTWFSEEQLSHEDGIALHKADAEFIALANPANILALVEALEKAQQQTTESENRVRKQNRHICELFDDNTALRQRIAGLESRTVKLPKLKMLEDYLAEVAIEERKQILVGVKLEFHRALTAAGINWEAE